MKYLIMLFVGLVILTGCDSNTEETTTSKAKIEEAQPELSQEEMTIKSEGLIAKVLNVSDLNLQLNDHSKWSINDDVYTKLMKVKQQIYVISGNMENYEVSSYNVMGKEFLDFINAIPVLESEAANVELQKVISSTKVQCNHMLNSDLQNSQIAVINLSIIYDEVPNYFVSAQN